MSEMQDDLHERAVKKLAKRLMDVCEPAGPNIAIEAMTRIISYAFLTGYASADQAMTEMEAFFRKTANAVRLDMTPPKADIRHSSIRHCLNDETGGMVDRLINEFLPSCVGRNDMAMANALIIVALMVAEAHCRQAGDDYGKLIGILQSSFMTASRIVGDDRPTS
jgi:hypothetical protein